jgi:hypothetical protein
VSIIAIMASMMLFALYRAQETAREQKTRALIAKLDAIVKAKWESYKTRRVPIAIPPGTNPTVAAQTRLRCLRDLMRMELPDRWSDIVEVTFNGASANPRYTLTTTPAGLQPPIMPNSPTRSGCPQSSVWRGYHRRVQSAAMPPTLDYQGAECLYLIVMAAVAEDDDGRDVFRPDNIGDVDNDGFQEFIDAWGRPIRFLRWPIGFQFSELQVVARGTANGVGPTFYSTGILPIPSAAPGAFVGGIIIQVNPATPTTQSFHASNFGRITGYDAATGTITYSKPPGSPKVTGPVAILAPDPFDPLRVHATIPPTNPPTPSCAVYPLIYSPGPDKAYGIVTDFPDNGNVLRYWEPSINFNPFTVVPALAPNWPEFIGNARDIPTEPNYAAGAWRDNIHNHMQGLR